MSNLKVKISKFITAFLIVLSIGNVPVMKDFVKSTDYVYAASKVKKGTTRGKTAFASVAEGSDHPRKMVTNAFIRRGVRTCKTSGTVISYKAGSMPNRGWAPLEEIEFSDYVEAWEK